MSVSSWLVAIAVLASCGTAHADFFEIRSVKLLTKEPRDGMGVWSWREEKSKRYPDQYQPCLEVTVSVRENVRSEKVKARAYFFDESNTIIAQADRPSPSGSNRKTRAHFDLPVLFSQGVAERLFFEIPVSIRSRKWKALVLFGDAQEMQAACWPASETDFLLDYPEKALVHDREAGKKADRKPAIDPLVEHVVKTPNPAIPQLTLFLRPPKGVTSNEEIRGVLTICILSGGIEQVRRDLQKVEMDGDYKGLFSFANKNKLAIIAWSAPGMWDPNANTADLSRERAKAIDDALDTVANAWERGVKELSRKYGIPDRSFLLWGSCGSAQWAHRVCLRKPQYFLAVHVHIPGSFDKPTPGANRILWCLTTGDLYAGYERSRRFYEECRKLGYPMVYKAIVGLGHAGHPDATALGFAFFEYALTQKAAREEYGRKMANSIQDTSKTPKPWLEGFQSPPVWGDIVSQIALRANKADRIAPELRTPLPTAEIAKIWDHGR